MLHYYKSSPEAETTAVRETLDLLADKDKSILWLYFFRDMPQTEITEKLGIPIGTVKSRLYTAKQNFKANYTYPSKTKEDFIIKRLPEAMPDYTIEKSEKAPFPVVWEEHMGWFVVPRIGEKLSWGMFTFTFLYSQNSVFCYCNMSVFLL